MIPENRYTAEELPQVNERIKTDEACQATLTLPYELRRKSRQRARLDDGREVALLLPRGTVLRQSDVLRASG
ncbi:MAG: hypothetical protein M1527_01010, partial [Gammaproteobacteria bacterium]|nr:hypothetical protein [Gammaproteobacteria bacterium]